MMIAKQLYRLRDELGAMGMAAIVLFIGAALFMSFVLQPLKDKSRSLAARAGALSAVPVSGSGASEKLAAVYQYLAKPEATTDWLAKLYAIGRATGVELQSANYKTQGAPAGRLERYEMTIPVTGRYTQIREFLNRALVEIPVLSLDQITLKREHRREGMLQAELRLTLHMVKP
ncbi:MAG TPA: GspMb/PilO family protein [Burkholderiales bacterium]|nr:GspMb/PilO family protein [Burkholderiales bacterium]